MKRRSGYGWLEFILGLVLIAVGIFTFVCPDSAGTAAVIIYGMAAIFTGIADIVVYAKTENHIGFGPTISLISGILSVMAGMMLIVYPHAGKWILSLLLPIWFIAHCISRLSQLNIVRARAGKFLYYFSMVVNILGLLLGASMLIRPITAYLTLGYIVGFYLILLGADCMVVAFSSMGSDW